MTISTTTRTAGPYAGTGANTAFPFSFKVFEQANVAVYRTETATTTTDTLVLGTDYAVTLNDDQNLAPGGTVTLTTALPTGYTLLLSSAVALLQPTQLTNLGGFYPEVLNDALDRLTICLQQVRAEITGTVPVGILPSGIQVAESIAALRGLPINEASPVAVVLGSASAGDGSGRLFWWDPTYSGADDGALTVAPSGWVTDGRWRWLQSIVTPSATPAEMAAGTETATRAMSPKHVAQAVAAQAPIAMRAFPRCIAWVVFNGTGILSVLAHYNVAAVTDNGIGDYTITLAQAAADANYCVSGTNSGNGTTQMPKATTTPTASAFAVQVLNTGGSAVDVSRVSIQVVR